MQNYLSINLITGFFIILLSFFSVYSQEKNTPVVVQPGAPGKPAKVLPSDTSAKLSPFTKADVEFMQGMIHHHAQAVEMAALMKDRTKNKKLLLFGSRISHTQAEEIKLMKRWLLIRGQKTSMQMPMVDMEKSGKMEMSKHKNHKEKMKMSEHANHQMLMPGMLTPKQMKALAKAKGKKFDNLFLAGMIQHHEGALVMVADLFNSSGAGQDAEIFTFANDVDSTQRAEIRLMNNMLKEKTN